MTNLSEPQKEETQKISRLGIGPLFATLSISYFVVTVALSFHLRPLFAITALSSKTRFIIAAIFICPGLILYISGVKYMLTAYKEGRLCTTGPFGICRHPIYSAWILFLVPGLAFWANSLLSFTTLPVMYLLFKMLIKKEDRYLQATFGAEYRRYRQNTPEILPFGRTKTFRPDNRHVL